MTADLDKGPPEEVPGDQVHRVVRAGVSMIPVIGGAAVELFNKLIPPPLEKRRNAWWQSLHDRISRLEERETVKLDDLSQREGFVSTLLQASQIAMRNHQEEKLQALRNAVVNSALPGAPDDSKQTMFLSLVDVFTPWHLRVLNFLADPPAWFKAQGQAVPQSDIMSSLRGVLGRAFPDLVKDTEFAELVIRDLYDRKLSRVSTITLNMSTHVALEKAATDLGNQFLRFVTAPSEV